MIRKMFADLKYCHLHFLFSYKNIVWRKIRSWWMSPPITHQLAVICKKYFSTGHYSILNIRRAYWGTHWFLGHTKTIGWWVKSKRIAPFHQFRFAFGPFNFIIFCVYSISIKKVFILWPLLGICMCMLAGVMGCVRILNQAKRNDCALFQFFIFIFVAIVFYCWLRSVWCMRETSFDGIVISFVF